MQSGQGFYTPKNREQLDRLLDLNVMPKKGRRTQEDLKRETAEAFVEARRQHPAIESATGNLNHRGWGWCARTVPEGLPGRWPW